MVSSPKRLLEPPEHVHDGQLKLRVAEEARGVEHARPLDGRPGISCGQERDRR